MKPVSEIRTNVLPHWVGDGFPVRSLFSYQEGNAFDPFLLLDYAGPYQFTPIKIPRGVGEHPHRGFETVTIIYQGELEHRDSTGHHGLIGAGDVQWMTAASGIVHEEFHSERFAREGGTLEMIQLWINLPADDKLSPPGYQEVHSGQIPRVKLPDNAGTVRVIAGEFQATPGPAHTFTPINVWDLELNPGITTELQLPESHTALLVVQAGEGQVNDTPVKGVELVAFDRAGDSVRLHAASALRALVLSGEPINEPVVGRGPFVMNTREQIQEALRDYHAGKMGHL